MYLDSAKKTEIFGTYGVQPSQCGYKAFLQAPKCDLVFFLIA